MVKVFIETSKGSSKKYELVTGKLALDQILPKGLKFPTNYGFIPDTKAPDGDALDIILISKPVKPGYYDVKIIGILKTKDEGVRDDKVITVPKTSAVSSLAGLKIKAKILQFMLTYKGDKIKILGWGSAKAAEKQLKLSKT